MRTALLGVDPSPSSGGTALRLGTRTADPIVTKVVQLVDVGAYLASLRRVVDGVDRLVVVIECPARMYRGSAHIVRSCATQWALTLKREFGPKVVFVKDDRGRAQVDPSVWRAALYGYVGPDPDYKALAIRYCRTTLGLHIADHNIAEAVCLCEYARRQLPILDAVRAANQAAGRARAAATRRRKARRRPYSNPPRCRRRPSRRGRISSARTIASSPRWTASIGRW